MFSRISLELEPTISKTTNKGGRPRKELDQPTFEALCEIQCTLAEIAGVLRVSQDTIERWCERTYELRGNATMLIWLGKQYLGQTDKPNTEEPDEEIDPQEISRILSSALSEAAARSRHSERIG